MGRNCSPEPESVASESCLVWGALQGRSAWPHVLQQRDRETEKESRQVRGPGLMIGLEFTDKAGPWIRGGACCKAVLLARPGNETIFWEHCVFWQVGPVSRSQAAWCCSRLEDWVLANCQRNLANLRWPACFPHTGWGILLLASLAACPGHSPEGGQRLCAEGRKGAMAACGAWTMARVA